MFEKPLHSGVPGVASEEEPWGDSEELASPALKTLLRSHAELCSALRSAGRQIFRLEGDVEFLSKLRETIRNAETVRKSWRNPHRIADTAPAAFGLGEIHPITASRNGSSKRSRRMRRPRSPGILKF